MQRIILTLPITCAPVYLAAIVYGYAGGVTWLLDAGIAAICYLAFGLWFLRRACPCSWAAYIQKLEEGDRPAAFRVFHNAAIAWSLWPWWVAAAVVHKLTGRFPSWGPWA